MNNTRNKAVSVILAMVMALSLMQAAVFAEEDTLSATVEIVANGQTVVTSPVTVSKAPEKPYIPSGSDDPLSGAASVYDAIVAAVGADKITASWSEYGIYMTAVQIGETVYAAVSDEPVIKDNGGYTKYSGSGWTYTVDGKTGSSMSGETLSDKAKIVLTYAPYSYEDGTYKATVKFHTPDGDTQKEVSVPVKPQKDYVTEESSDTLDGMASVYDALLEAAGKENIKASNTFITAITVGETEYASKSNDPKFFCDLEFMLSSGFDWTYTVNGEYAPEYAPNMKLEYGDVIEFSYGAWNYCMNTGDYSSVSTSYAASKITLTDLQGNKLDGLAHESVMANVKLVKLTADTAEDYDGYLILAGYDENGKIISFQYLAAQMEPEKEYSLGALINVPEDRTLSTVKAFFWDGLDTMVPLSQNREYGDTAKAA